MNNEIKKHNLSWDPYAKSYNEWINEQLHSFKAKAWTNIILENAPKKEWIFWMLVLALVFFKYY